MLKMVVPILDVNGKATCKGNNIMGKLVIGINDFETWCKNNGKMRFLEEWDYDANDGIVPSAIACSAAKPKIQWKCSLGHSWTASINSRVSCSKRYNSGCPYCSNEKTLPGFNDFATWCKKNSRQFLLKEWDYSKNIVAPNEIAPTYSKNKIWWICKKGHSFSTKLGNRVCRDSNCPICSNRVIVAGINDFETWCKNNKREKLLDEWDFNENRYTPQELNYGSAIHINWRCVKGHKWNTELRQRTMFSETNCPKCARESHTSFPEQAIYYYIRKQFDDAINNDRTALNGLELDIFIPSMSVAIEYDGYYFHNKKKKVSEKDTKKDLLCQKKNIFLFRVREMEDTRGYLKKSDSTTFDYEYQNWNQLNQIIRDIFLELDITDTDIDVIRDKTFIEEQYMQDKLDKSLAKKFPEIAMEWHPTKNGNITPQMVSYGSEKQYWFQCKLGHEYKQTICSKTGKNKTKCPYCSGQKLLQGFNDFEVWCKNNNREDLLREWNYEKNDKKPNEINKGTSKKIYWKCSKCEYEWQASVRKRGIEGRGCPACANNNKGSWCKKEVLCIELNKKFESTTAAATFLGLKKGTTIGFACHDINKTAGGFHWKYVEK